MKRDSKKMEEEMIISSSTWISDTNWNVIHGALHNSISFETPISAIEEGKFITPTDDDQLQLVKPSDSGPCEITISFKQKHEIRQIYVRSTARVYEIYYAADQQQSSNEYLCTVRCCTASKGDTSLQESDIIENQEGSIETVEHLADKTKNDRSNGTGEDGWVEVKVQDSMADKNNGNAERSIQDFYEATAEISDANPCISLTLRLLSLQTQGCAQVEEIYIFAEPVDSEDQGGPPTENSAGSSLMAMLVPTLLNLSKTGNSRTQERHVSDIRERLSYHNDNSNGTETLKSMMGMTKKQEGKANMPDGATKVEEVTRENADPAHSQSSKQVPSTGQGPEFVTKETDLPFSRIEKVLDHLVCRVVRLEAFCLRFEENMLKPISNIETKLQGLEKQLELLTMRSQPSEFYPSTRITAPEFSCTESQSNSLYNDGNDGNCHRCKDARYTRITAPEFVCTESESNSFHHEVIDDQKDIYVAESSFPIDDAPHPDVPRSCPGLVVTAPEFSNDDDDECDDNRDGDEKKCSDVSELYHKGSSRDKPSLSLDDALASALAGFLTMASVQPPGLTETSELITPEIPSEENGDNHKLKSPSAIPSEQDPETGSSSVESNRKQNVIDSDVASCCSSQGNEPQVKSPSAIPSEQDPETGSSSVESNRKQNVNDSDVASCCSSQGNEPQVKSPSAIPSEQDPETGSSCVRRNRKENVNDSDVASCCSSQGNEPQVTKLTNESPANALDLGQGEFQELKGNCENTSINQTGSQTSSSILISNGTMIDEEWFTTPTDESGTGTEKITLEEQHFIEQNNYQTADDISEACLDLTTTKESQSAEDSKNSSKCVLQRTYSSTVDFELPILDVKFAPHENWKAGSSLEFLLDDMPETKIEDFYVKDEDNGAASAEFLHADNPETNFEDFCVKDRDNGVASVEQCEQFSSDDKEFGFSNLDEQLLVGIDNLSESIQESLTCTNHDKFLSLI